MKAFLKKEWMEMTRTGRLLILTVIFILFGIMNPAIAKLTPWLMEMMKESIAESGLSVGTPTVNAMTSWTQFYKNAPMALIVIVLMSCGVLVNEYQHGTLVQVVTKGLSRRKVFLSKMITVLGSWTVMFALYFGVTYGYTAYFWGEDKVEGIFFGAFAYWLLGVFVLTALLMCSAAANSGGQVLMGTGIVFLVMFFLNYIPKIQKFLPLRLMNGLQVSTGALQTADFTPAIIVAGVCTAVFGIAGTLMFDRKAL